MTVEFLIDGDTFEPIILPYAKDLEALGIKATVRDVDGCAVQAARRQARLRHHRRQFRPVELARQRAARFLGFGRRRQRRQPQYGRHQEPGRRQAHRQDRIRERSRRAGRRDASARSRAAVELSTSFRIGTIPTTASPIGTFSAGPAKLPSQTSAPMQVWWIDPAKQKAVEAAKAK